ncbi:Glycosyltransferase family 92 protein [Caenorhabditis elegans]|uniref:Glycosyltransferase family 92 protein n=1 Tax=Caenorhabditis elegans TaxID=6239 RepID=O02319_CAEEL|nr:Glycosyltransferase family 92 protein [Caenorhabditis elegans]CAB05625.1 Glycosyltransferase family 92 protein [Caenorhabditis elegans]|eukprot:NP_493143.1 Uncharacterized protein CELE_T15D6.12 [Caenorhabditis elegans]
MKIRKTSTILFVLSSIFVLFYLVNSALEQIQQLAYFFESEEQIDSSFPIKFYNVAYVDYRYDSPRLRIFTLNHCISKKNFLSVDLYYKGISSPTKLKVYGKSLEETCPSSYIFAKPCFYVAHTFFANLELNGRLEKVTINLGDREVNLAVKEVYKKHEKGLTLCLQPVYYYSQWQNIVLYIEAWRAHGASRFIVYYHSATKDTWKVLEYYRDMGIIEIRPWPNFGSLPPQIEKKYPKIDDSVYGFSYFLALNLCILDIKTTIGSVADFDEVMVPHNGTMLEYASKEMTGTNVGALLFKNSYVSLEPSIYDNEFTGVSKPVFLDGTAAPKYVFNATVIDIAQTHWVRSFTDSTKHTKVSDGTLLHHRFDAKWKRGEEVEKMFTYFPNNTSEHVASMQKTSLTIFNGSPPMFSFDLINGLNNCVLRIKETPNTCQSTGGMCRAHMDRMSEWIYDKTKNIFL